MSSQEGRQSPPPESQSGAQLKDTPASGLGTDQVNTGEKKGAMNDQLSVRRVHSWPRHPPC